MPQDYYFYSIFDQINAALVNIRYFQTFQTDPKK